MASHNTRLAKRLREARLLTEMTMEAVADAIDTSATTIWRYEAGQRRPSGPTLHALASVYSRPIEWFFGEGDSEFPPLIPEQIEANRELVMSEPMLALRAASANLDDDDMADIADYIRFVQDREKRRRRER